MDGGGGTQPEPKPNRVKIGLSLSSSGDLPDSGLPAATNRIRMKPISNSSQWKRLLCAAFLSAGLVAGTASDGLEEGSEEPLPPATTAFKPGDLVFTDSGAALRKYDKATSETSTVSSGGMLIEPFAIAIAPDGTFYVTDPGCFSVIAVNPRTGVSRMLPRGKGLGVPYGITVTRQNEIYVANGQSVVKVDPVTGATTKASRGRLIRYPLGVASAPNGDLYVADAAGLVARIDHDTGFEKGITRGHALVTPVGITMAGADALYVSDFNTTRIVRVNPQTGAQTVVASGGYLTTPLGLALRGSNELLVADPDAFDFAGGIIRVDLSRGTQAPVTSGNGRFVNARGVAVVPVWLSRASFNKLPTRVEP